MNNDKVIQAAKEAGIHLYVMPTGSYYTANQESLAKFAELIQSQSEPVKLNNMSNSPEQVRKYIEQSMPNNSKEIIALMTSPNIDECVNRFLGWKLPSDFSPDCGISFEQYSNQDNDRYKALRKPTGTNLFNAKQAKAMFQHVLKGATTELVVADRVKAVSDTPLSVNEQSIKLIAEMAAIIRVQNGNKYDDINAILLRADQAIANVPNKGE